VLTVFAICSLPVLALSVANWLVIQVQPEEIKLRNYYRQQRALAAREEWKALKKAGLV
jgi:hypothetical protein